MFLNQREYKTSNYQIKIKIYEVLPFFIIAIVVYCQLQ